MPHDPVDQVEAHIITLTDPDHPVLVGHGQDEATPLFVAVGKIVKPGRGGRRVDDRCTGCVHQHLTPLPPHLESQLAFIGGPDPVADRKSVV